jgi:calcineurin-like phosphoesterase family protein
MLVAIAVGSASAAHARVPVIAAAGDIACDPRGSGFSGGLSRFHCGERATSNLILRGTYRAVLALGDLQYKNGRLWKFRRSYGPTWGRFKPKTLPVIGNHEYGTYRARGYFNYFNGRGVLYGRAGERPEGWYSRDLGRWHVIALNSNCEAVDCSPDSPQIEWLVDDLRSHPDRCVLAAYHHPRFSSGHHEEDQDVRTIWRVLYRAGVDVVLNGHDHDYERFAPKDTRGRVDHRQGIVEFVVGTGGHSLFPFPRRMDPTSRAHQDSRFGILRMRLGHGRYRWAYKVTPSGRTVDSGSRRCTPLGPLITNAGGR